MPKVTILEHYERRTEVEVTEAELTLLRSPELDDHARIRRDELQESILDKASGCPEGLGWIGTMLLDESDGECIELCTVS